MKKICTLLVITTVVLLLQSATKRVNFSGQPPTGLTGASGNYCTNCHNSFSLNSSGGKVSVSGLPSSDYVPGQTYTFSLTISHSAANRKRWGFSITAVDANGNPTGEFASNNANAAPQNNQGTNDELSHFSAVSTAAQQSFTYTNLQWTAPTTAGLPIKFYFVGNAGNGAGGSSGDFIYSGSSNIVLPIQLTYFTATANSNNEVLLNWQTATETNNNFFDIEKSDDGQQFYSIGKVAATQTTSTAKTYRFTDNKPSFLGRSIFYRLKQIDNNGSFTYSSVTSVQLKPSSLLVTRVYPTAFKAGTVLTAQINTNQKEQIQVVLIDASGKLVGKTAYSVNTGNNIITFQPTNSAKGMLYAKFISTKGVQTIPLVVN